MVDRAEKKQMRTLEESEDIHINLIEFQESAFLDERKRAVEFLLKDFEAIFTPNELQKLSNYELVSDGFGGTCDWCGSQCEESVFLELEFDFISLHPACYGQLRGRINTYYSEYKPDIISFSI